MEASSAVSSISSPLQDLGLQLRKAAAVAKDEQSYANFANIVEQAKNAGLLDAKGPTSDKAALNFVMEFLFESVLNQKKIALPEINYRLKAIDLLLSAGASISVLLHPATQEIAERVAKVAKLTRPEVFNFPEIFGHLQANEQVLLAVHCWVKNTLKAEKLLLGLRLPIIFDRDLRGMSIAAFNKPLIVFEHPADDGAYLLFSRLDDRLKSADYKTVCLDFEHDVDLDSIAQNFKGMLQARFARGEDLGVSAEMRNDYYKLMLAQQKQFEIVKFNPCNSSYDDLWGQMLNSLTTDLLGWKMATGVRIEGMYTAILHAIYKKQGKVVVFIKHGYATVIEKLHGQGIESIVVAPCFDPKVYAGATAGNHGFDRIFNLCKAEQLNLANNTDALDKFWEKYFPAANVSKSRPLHKHKVV